MFLTRTKIVGIIFIFKQNKMYANNSFQVLLPEKKKFHFKCNTIRECNISDDFKFFTFMLLEIFFKCHTSQNCSKSNTLNCKVIME